MSLFVNIITYIFIFFLLSKIYIYIWKKSFKNKIPTGYGIIFFLSIIYFFVSKYNFDKYILLTFIFINIIYWLDDLFGLNFIIRIFLQFCSGIFLLFLLANNFIYLDVNFLYLFLIISIIFVLSNFVNFYDGADLNLSIFVISNLIIIFLFSNKVNEFENFLILSISFFVAFSFINFKPQTLYLGDSAALSISILYTSYLFYNLININLENLLLITPIFFILIDCSTVIFIRLKRKENLLERNYLHLYQKLEQNFNNKIYLLPVILNALLVTLIIILFKLKLIDIYFSFLLIFSLSFLIYVFFLWLLKVYE